MKLSTSQNRIGGNNSQSSSSQMNRHAKSNSIQFKTIVKFSLYHQVDTVDKRNLINITKNQDEDSTERNRKILRERDAIEMISLCLKLCQNY